MSGNGPRGLSPEERALWNRVRRRVAPLGGEPGAGSARKLARKMEQTADPGPAPAREWVPAAFRIGEKATTGTAGKTEPAPVAPRMDSRQYARLRRGRLAPQARIDLHGMTVAQAHPALSAFITESWSRGVRLVLVITGKGRGRDRGDGPIPIRPGVLRHHVPQWLQSGPLAQMVLQVSEAHGRHGGAGALYVYLKRRR